MTSSLGYTASQFIVFTAFDLPLAKLMTSYNLVALFECQMNFSFPLPVITDHPRLQVKWTATILLLYIAPRTGE